jgi:hypothetical protein
LKAGEISDLLSPLTAVAAYRAADELQRADEKHLFPAAVYVARQASLAIAEHWDSSVTTAMAQSLDDGFGTDLRTLCTLISSGDEKEVQRATNRLALALLSPW